MISNGLLGDEFGVRMEEFIFQVHVGPSNVIINHVRSKYKISIVYDEPRKSRKFALKSIQVHFKSNLLSFSLSLLE